ncbi:MAG: hypothetical protein MI725_10220, partial [Pirellulales bacterium]|nr:hypothetical protein [Pirellulales bacterium]
MAKFLKRNDIAAILALSELKGERARDHLIGAFDKVSTKRWWLLAENLGRFGDHAVVPELKRRLAEVEQLSDRELPARILVAFAEAIESAEGTDKNKASDTATRTRHFVRVVSGKDKIAVEDKIVARDELKSELQKIPNRAHTVLEYATTPEGEANLDGELLKLAIELGFEYYSFVGIHPLTSKGGTTKEHVKVDAEREVELEKLLKQISQLPEKDRVQLVLADDKRWSINGLVVPGDAVLHALRAIPSRGQKVLEVTAPRGLSAEDLKKWTAWPPHIGVIASEKYQQAYWKAVAEALGFKQVAKKTRQRSAKRDWRKKLIGTWSAQPGDGERWIITFNEDGTFVTPHGVKGKWRLRDDILVGDATETNMSESRHTEQRIVYLDDKTIHLEHSELPDIVQTMYRAAKFHNIMLHRFNSTTDRSDLSDLWKKSSTKSKKFVLRDDVKVVYQNRDGVVYTYSRGEIDAYYVETGLFTDNEPLRYYGPFKSNPVAMPGPDGTEAMPVSLPDEEIQKARDKKTASSFSWGNPNQGVRMRLTQDQYTMSEGGELELKVDINNGSQQDRRIDLLQTEGNQREKPTYWVGYEQLDADALREQVERWLLKSPNSKVHVRANKNLTHHHVAQLVDRLKQWGVQNVALSVFPHNSIFAIDPAPGRDGAIRGKVVASKDARQDDTYWVYLMHDTWKNHRGEPPSLEVAAGKTFEFRNVPEGKCILHTKRKLPPAPKNDFAQRTMQVELVVKSKQVVEVEIKLDTGAPSIAWGAPQHGIRCAANLVNPLLVVDDPLPLEIRLQNNSEKGWVVQLQETHLPHGIEVNGTLYRQFGSPRGGQLTVGPGSGLKTNQSKIELDGWFASGDRPGSRAEPLKLPPGKHQVRILYYAQKFQGEFGKAPYETVEIYSQPVEVEVVAQVTAEKRTDQKAKALQTNSGFGPVKELTATLGHGAIRGKLKSSIPSGKQVAYVVSIWNEEHSKTRSEEQFVKVVKPDQPFEFRQVPAGEWTVYTRAASPDEEISRKTALKRSKDSVRVEPNGVANVDVFYDPDSLEDEPFDEEVFIIAAAEHDEKPDEVFTIKPREGNDCVVRGKVVGPTARAILESNSYTVTLEHDIFSNAPSLEISAGEVFEFRNVPRGRAGIRVLPTAIANKRGYPSAQTPYLKLDAGETAWVELSFANAHSVSGVVRQEDGTPIAGAEIMAMFSSDNGLLTTALKVISG